MQLDNVSLGLLFGVLSPAAETVTVDGGTGDLLLPDKWGDVHRARHLANGSYMLLPQPVVQMGPGRVLGSKLDAAGNLVMCDVLKVCLTYDNCMFT